MSDEVSHPPADFSCYLFIQTGTEPASAKNVVYDCPTEQRAKTLCQLFDEEYGRNLRGHFAFQKSDSLNESETLRIQEAFDDLRLYTDADRFIYEPSATQFDIDRAQFMFRADRLNDLLGKPIENCSSNPARTATLTTNIEDVETALATLLRAVEKHRLTFLYFAKTYRRNPADSDESWFGMKSPVPGFSIPVEKIDANGEFLFEYKWYFDRVAQAAHSRYGTGDGSRPTSVGASGERIEIEGGSLPYWKLGDDDCIHMEESVNHLIQACSALLRSDRSRRYRKVVDTVRAVMHDNNQKKWYSPNLVRWSFLTDLDEAIHFIKMFELTSHMDSADVDGAAEIPTSQVPDESATQPKELSSEEQRIAKFKKELEEFLANPASLQTAPEDLLNTNLHLLFMFAQIYYKLLESATSYGCYALDLSFNQSYLSAIKNLSNLLKNSEELKDFPGSFEPMFPDLYPATITDCDWPDYVQPHAEGFLSTVQKYVYDKGIFDPPAGSHAETMLAYFEPQRDNALKNASEYAAKMKAHVKRLFPPPPPVPANATGQSDVATQAASADTPLAHRAQEVLEAMFGLGAVDSDNRKTTAEIAPIASGGDPNSLKAVISELRIGGFVLTKEGRHGGCWLTPTGLERAKKLRKQNL